MAIELFIVQFWSEIIFVISNHAYDFRPNCTPFSSITIINMGIKLIVLQKSFTICTCAALDQGRS